jgi:hypothetical protein
MMAIQIRSDPNSTIGTPKELFILKGPFSVAGNLTTTYDIARDGRFLKLLRIENSDYSLVCVKYRFYELEQLTSSGCFNPSAQ